MGLIGTLRPGIRPGDLTAAATLGGVTAGPGPAPLAIASPWAGSNHLARVSAATVWADILGSKVLPMTRAQAMAVPAAARARHVICGTVARTRLRAFRGDQRLERPDAPTWLDATNGQLPPFHRMLWTVDDLLWSGWSCWSRTNGWDTKPYQMDRIPMERWAFGNDSEGRTVVVVDDQPQRADQVLLIPGPHEGLLVFAQEAIRHAADLQRAAGRAAKHPAAYLAIRQTKGAPPLPQSSTDPNVASIDGIIAGWTAAREGEKGGVAFLTEGLEAQELGTFDRHLVLDGRNAAAVDIARSASLPADLLDAAGEASLTYQNARDNDRRAVDYGVGMYMDSIAATLSQDAIVPAGMRVDFDLAWLAGTDPNNSDPDQATPGAAPAPVRPPAQQPAAQPAPALEAVR